jgi:curved DNA-binding protein CbpA
LGAPKDATLEEIKKIYKKAALKWHPDRWASKTEQEKTAAHETFQKINRAFEILSDPVKRRRYDSDIFDKAGSLNKENVFVICQFSFQGFAVL